MELLPVDRHLDVSPHPLCSALHYALYLYYGSSVFCVGIVTQIWGAIPLPASKERIMLFCGEIGMLRPHHKDTKARRNSLRYITLTI